MKNTTATLFIGFGIPLFLVGDWGFLVNEHLVWLALIGTAMTFTGIIFWFKNRRTSPPTAPTDKRDPLTYFWKVMFLKLIVGMFAVNMVFKLIFFLMRIGR